MRGLVYYDKSGIIKCVTFHPNKKFENLELLIVDEHEASEFIKGDKHTHHWYVGQDEFSTVKLLKRETYVRDKAQFFIIESTSLIDSPGLYLERNQTDYLFFRFHGETPDIYFGKIPFVVCGFGNPDAIETCFVLKSGIFSNTSILIDRNILNLLFSGNLDIMTIPIFKNIKILRT